MTWHYPTFAFAFVFASIIALLVAIVALRRRNVPGSVTFALLMFGVAEWSFFRALEAMAVQMPAKILWGKLEYPGIVSVPLLWFIFTLEYSNSPRWFLRRRYIALLWILPIITTLLTWTNEWHGWIWSQILPGDNPIDFIIYEHGFWFWIHVVYSYCLMFIGTLQLLRDVLRFPQRYREQIGALLIGAALPWIGNALYIARLSPLGLDLTPFMFAASGVIYALSVFRFQLFELVPVARDVLIEKMVDGVIVLDTQDRIVDINPAAFALVGAHESVIGKHIEHVVTNQSELIGRYRDVKEAQTEIAVGEPDTRHLDLRISALYDKQDQYTGRLIVLRDITERKRAETKNQALFDAIPDLVFQYDANGTCIACNSVRHDGSVLASAATVGKSVDETLPPALVTLTKSNIRRTLETGQVQSYEYSLPIEGHEHYFVARMEVCAPNEVITVIRDVTERRRLEAELRRINEQSQIQLEQIEDLQTMLHDQAIRDPSTGLFNRHYLDETLERELSRAKRSARPVSLIVIDIDRFKTIREEHGHRAGQLVQQALANLLRDQSRLADIACRIEEDFVMVLPGAGSDVAMRRAEQWRATFAEMPIPFEGTDLLATISLGVAVYPFHSETGNGLLRAAEQALAEAKSSGRDCIVMYQTSSATN
ncbi:MAG: diguanylate cyclase [Chloroflexi bacterium]|nr:diguanylate cyclase [Chloroflexota bacterium]